MAGLKKISILGSTGSIGRSTVDVVMMRPGDFDVQALTANTNVEVLAAQAVRLKAKRAVVANPQKYDALKTLLAGTDVEAAAGREALQEAAAMPADWIMAAIVGMAGLRPLIKAIEQGNCVAIANKEPLAAAGPIVMEAVRKAGTTLLPVDSEHNAVFQVFDHERPEGIKKIILTASGGPFRTRKPEDMKDITPEQAVAHPNWSMGAKISVDSATMMNKALEVIEAHYLFGIPSRKIEVVIHPQSTVHSMVEYIDGSVLAQMGAPDMRTPIAHALAWPARMETPGAVLDWRRPLQLDFAPLDPQQFPAVPLAYECLHSLDSCVTLNAANEVSVDAFLQNKTGFPNIIKTVRHALDETRPESLRSLDDITEFDKRVRERTRCYIMGA